MLKTGRSKRRFWFRGINETCSPSCISDFDLTHRFLRALLRSACLLVLAPAAEGLQVSGFSHPPIESLKSRSRAGVQTPAHLDTLLGSAALPTGFGLPVSTDPRHCARKVRSSETSSILQSGPYCGFGNLVEHTARCPPESRPRVSPRPRDDGGVYRVSLESSYLITSTLPALQDLRKLGFRQGLEYIGGPRGCISL